LGCEVESKKSLNKFIGIFDEYLNYNFQSFKANKKV